jgi:hypothetical protein
MQPLHAVLALGLFAGAANAKTFPVPPDDPIATISLPDAWGPNVYDGGVEATSPDGTTYIAVEEVAAEDVRSAVEEGIKFFAKSGVEIDAQNKTMRKIKLNGLAAYDVSLSGTDKDGPADVSLTLVETNAKAKFLLLYYWRSPQSETANGAALKTISDSIQATK